MKDYMILKNNSGLTLIELMIVLVLSLLLMSAVYLSYQVQHQTSNEQHQVMAIQQDLRAVMDIMEKDIRNAGCDPLYSNTPTNIIFGIQGPLNTSSLTVTFDIDADGVEGISERAVYNLAGGSLQRNGDELVGNVTNLVFTYLDEDDISTATIAEVRSIEVQIDIQSQNADFNRSLSRRVQFRNMGM